MPAPAAEVEDLIGPLVEFRRDLHANPELGFKEHRTSERIASLLVDAGMEVHRGIGGTGLVGVLKTGSSTRAIGLRADMDALPINENSGAAHSSRTPGVFHGCGHDGHVAMLLGAAQHLARTRRFDGIVNFIFQPAEEGPPGDEEGGAPLMIKEGVMDNPKVDAIFGLHINSQTPIGKIKFKPGAEMASSDWFTVKVKGKQSHGSQPWSGIDPVVVAAQIIQGFQTIVSRQAELTKAPVVITVGKIHSGVRSNIIPEELVMEGTIRTLDSKMQQQVHERMKQMATHIAAASGATAEVSIDTKTKVTYNDCALVKRMIPSLELAAGKENVTETEWTTGAEDFSFFGDKAPAFFFFLGGMPEGQDPAKAAAHHTPDFYIDDSKLDVGVKAFCQLVFDYSASKK